MSTYVTRQIQLTVAENQNGSNQIIKRGDTPTKFDAVAALEEVEFKKYVIALPETDKDLLAETTIGTAKILYIETDTELTVKLVTTGDTGFKVKPLVSDDAETKKGTLYLEGEFSHVYVTPTGSSGNANVTMGVVGA